MSLDIFLLLDGITGESKDSAHAGEIDILAWSWGVSQSGTMHEGGGGGAGKASFQDISATKYIDKSSPTLWKNLTTGTHVVTGKLTVRKAGGTQLEYVIIELKKVLITSISTGGSGGEDRLTENISLNFEEFKFSYTPQKDDGTGDAAVEFAWNIAENVEK